MTDLSKTIAPKSDQLNADDLIVCPLTITITRVSSCGGEQPIAINFDGDNGKPYKPCKSMRRVLVAIWGKDGANYVGRSMTLYNDADVAFGGSKVGGIRISHMSHMQKEVTMALTATRAKRKPYTVKPLVIANPVESLLQDANTAAIGGTDSLKRFWDWLTTAQKVQLKDDMPKLKEVAAKITQQKSETAPLPHAVTDPQSADEIPDHSEIHETTPADALFEAKQSAQGTI